MINPMEIMKIKQRLDTFNSDHPKVGPFFRSIGKNAMMPGTIVELKVTTPDGKDFISNIKVNENDVETLRSILDLSSNGK